MIQRNGMRKSNFEKYSLGIISMMNEGYRSKIEILESKLIEEAKLTKEILKDIDSSLLKFDLIIIDQFDLLRHSSVHMTVLKSADPMIKSMEETRLLYNNSNDMIYLGYDNVKKIETAIFKSLKLSKTEINCCDEHKDVAVGMTRSATLSPLVI
jgi:hypothetical protein